MRARRGPNSFLVGFAFIAGTVALFAAMPLLRGVSRQRGNSLLPAEQRQAGNFSMPLLDGPAGEEWTLAAHRGEVVLLNYFATWCGPCRQEMPDLVKVARDYGPRGVAMAAVSMDGEEPGPGRSREELLRDYAKREGILFPILLPPKDSVLWRLDFPVPQTFVYDRKGRRAYVVAGPVDARELRETLDALLQEAP